VSVANDDYSSAATTLRQHSSEQSKANLTLAI